MNHFELEQQYRTRSQQLEYAAARSRLAHDAADHTPRENVAVFGPALARLGDALVAAGTQLQERYGQAMEQVHEQAKTATGTMLAVKTGADCS